MHVFVVLVELGCVSLRGESSKAFLVDIETKGLVAGDDYVDAQVELVAVDQKRIGHVA